MKTIYFGVGTSICPIEEVEEITVYTSYTDDGYLTDSYDEDDILRFIELENFMYENMESCFVVINQELTKNEVIDYLSKIKGFEYCSKLDYGEEEDGPY